VHHSKLGRPTSVVGHSGGRPRITTSSMKGGDAVRHNKIERLASDLGHKLT
jgi:hypothetical protein